MEAQSRREQESVIVLSEEQGAIQALGEGLSGVAVQTAVSLHDALEKAAQNQSSLVILDCDWSLETFREALYQLRHSEAQPALMVVSRHQDPRAVSELYRHGCQRYIPRDDAGMEEIAPAVRHILRSRQLEEENLRIRTRLTEANMLLAERNRRLDEFSASIAHDIRGPLGSLSMRLEYLRDNYPLSDPRAAQVLDRSHDSCKRLLQIVQAMYDYAKLGSDALKMGWVELDTLLDGVIIDLQGSHDKSLDIEIARGELPRVWGNEGLLRRVFHNLLGNAIKYSDKQEIRIRVESTSPEEGPFGPFQRISVSDNGPGISAGEREGIFNMFRRGNSAEGSAEGSGIGLAVVRRIVELHYGEIHIESHPEGGACFVFSLLLSPCSQSPLPE